MLLKCLYRTLIVTNFKCNLCLHLIILWMIAIWTCLKMLHDTEAGTLNSLCQHKFLTSFSLWLKVNSNICLTPCCTFLVYASPCCTCIVFVSPCCTVEPSWCMFPHDSPSWLCFSMLHLHSVCFSMLHLHAVCLFMLYIHCVFFSMLFFLDLWFSMLHLHDVGFITSAVTSPKVNSLVKVALSISESGIISDVIMFVSIFCCLFIDNPITSRR